MTRQITVQPLTQAAFAPFGQVLDTSGDPDRIINQGLCGRWHDRAALSFGSGRAGLSLFDATPRALPYDLTLVERHTLGSQAFVPLHRNPWLVIVAPARDAPPLALLAGPGQGINLDPGTWHGVLTPLHAPGLFAVIDRIAPDGEDPAANLDEHPLPVPWRIVGA